MTQVKHVFLWSAVLLLSLLSNFRAWAETDNGRAASNLRQAMTSSEPGSNNNLKRLSRSLLMGNGDTFEDDSIPGKDSDVVDMEKKGSSFVRIGKMYPMNRFIRIGKLYDESNLDDVSHPDKLEDDKRASRFVRIGKAPSRFVRIGKSEVDEQQNGEDKRASRFVRIGKASQLFPDQTDISLNRLERSMPFPRDDRVPSSFVRIGKAPSRFVRIGRAPSSFVRIGKAPSSFVRIGKAPSNFVRIGKAPSSFVRIGKAPSSFVRIGKAPSSFVRIGKTPSNFIRIGKAPSSFVRIGKSDSDFVDKSLDTDYIEVPDYSEKRASRFVRIGKGDISSNSPDNSNSIIEKTGQLSDEEKRTSSFVRIGKSELDDENSDTKRASSFVRIGKPDESNTGISESHKPGSNFVRFGESSHFDNVNSAPSPGEPSSTSSESVQDGNLADSEDSIKVATRGSAFVRIGKIPSSAFVRIGKNTDQVADEADYSRGFRGNQSSFVRIGK